MKKMLASANIDDDDNDNDNDAGQNNRLTDTEDESNNMGRALENWGKN